MKVTYSQIMAMCTSDYHLRSIFSGTIIILEHYVVSTKLYILITLLNVLSLIASLFVISMYLHYFNLLGICDVIKQNESELANIDY